MAIIECKVCVLGDVDVGKTSLCRRFVEDEFSPDKVKTVMVTNLTKEVVFGNDTVRFNIWDTAGDERFRAVIGIYYRGAKAVIVIYDCTSRESFDNMEYWLSEVKKKSEPDCMVLIVANKTDLVGEREVARAEGEALARRHKMRHFETSALTGAGVGPIFVAIGSALDPKKIRRGDPGCVVAGEAPERKSGGCC